MQRISDWLRDNPEGQAQLAEIERNLRPLEEGFEAIEAPSEDLLARTMAGIPAGLPPQADESSDRRDAPQVSLSEVDLMRESGARSSRWNRFDSIGGLLSVAVLLALLLPTIAAGRFESRKVACQDQLRELGLALMQYVGRDHQGRLPQVAQSGPEAFAGVYLIRLADAGLLNTTDPRWCPSAGKPRFEPSPTLQPSDFYPPHSNSTLSTGTLATRTLPSAAQLHHLPVNQLQRTQQTVGGHYAYNLGVIGDQGYSSPRYEARTSFAIMSDAPLGKTIAADGTIQMRFSHGDQGLNVLYEDGAVHFLRGDALDALPDNPLLNHSGTNEAGVNIDDASLAPSWQPPFTGSPQR
ncbi:hypothetical protein NHH03_00980 [Stieleria sp. TO1_6]|uniref:hypothetical protein n=1 Tax=Stieleria tagensis TaxID=2956795 RepID=UPI00209B83F4|nr:hypothetical protein [Stieleria tagensis]MCO8120290.1 hypothetical protein [Stieleria tagensis]